MSYLAIKKYLRARAKRLLNFLFKYFDHTLVFNPLLYDWQRAPEASSSFKESVLPEGAEEYLQPDNPRLKDLQKQYTRFNCDVTIPLVWESGYVTPNDLRYFRGDNAYVWQLRGINMNHMAYVLTTYYVMSIDRLKLLPRLHEDDNFGNYTFLVGNKKISRDLLDSLTEIYFLDKHLNISSLADLNILDIGAGYGRLAHRMTEAFPDMGTYFCTDAVAVSTFISEYYLQFCKLENRTKVIPLNNVENTLESNSIDIAINIHSFSECSLPAIEWWLALLAKSKVRYLFIVPNDTDNEGELLLTTDRQDFRIIIEKHGYKLKAKEPKYHDSAVQQYAINPTYHYLFELF